MQPSPTGLALTAQNPEECSIPIPTSNLFSNMEGSLTPSVSSSSAGPTSLALDEPSCTAPLKRRRIDSERNIDLLSLDFEDFDSIGLDVERESLAAESGLNVPPESQLAKPSPREALTSDPNDFEFSLAELNLGAEMPAFAVSNDELDPLTRRIASRYLTSHTVEPTESERMDGQLEDFGEDDWMNEFLHSA